MRVVMSELAANLSEFVALAAGGEEIVVTDDGRPVVRLIAWSKPAEVRRSRAALSIFEVLREDRG